MRELETDFPKLKSISYMVISYVQYFINTKPNILCYNDQYIIVNRP